MSLRKAKTAFALIVLMCIPLARVCADYAPARMLLGSREVQLTPSALYDGKRVLAPVSVLSALGLSHIAPTDMKKITIFTRSGSSIDVATMSVAGTPMLPMDAVLAAVGGSSAWDDAAHTLKLLAKLQSVEFADGALRVNCSLPVTCKTNSAGGKVWLDVDGAVLATDAREVYVGGPVVERVRLGQYTDTTARVTLDLLKQASYRLEGTLPAAEVVLKVDVPATKPASAAVSKPTVFSISGLRVDTISESQFNLVLSTAGKGKASIDYGALPPQIVLRLPGGVLPDPIPTVSASHPLLKGVTCRRSASGVGSLITLDLARICAYDLTVGADSITLSVRMPDKAGGKLSEKFIVIDPGHGGHDPGAHLNCGGMNEKDVNLRMADELAAALQKEGVRTLVTRGEEFITLSERPRVALDNWADFFISLHCNACQVKNSGTGIETYYYNREPEARQSLAYAIHAAVCVSTGMCDGGAHGKNLAVLRGLAGSGVPGILLECGYLNHDLDRAKLLSADYRAKLISGIITGLRAYIEGVPIN